MLKFFVWPPDEQWESLLFYTMATSIYHSSMIPRNVTLRCRAIQKQWVAGFAQGYIFQKPTALPKQEVAAWGVDGRSSPTQHAWWRTAAKLHTHHKIGMFPQGRAFFLKNEAWFGYTKQLSLGTEIFIPETKQKKTEFEHRNSMNFFVNLFRLIR